MTQLPKVVEPIRLEEPQIAFPLLDEAEQDLSQLLQQIKQPSLQIEETKPVFAAAQTASPFVTATKSRHPVAVQQEVPHEFTPQRYRPPLAYMASTKSAEAKKTKKKPPKEKIKEPVVVAPIIQTPEPRQRGEKKLQRELERINRKEQLEQEKQKAVKEQQRLREKQEQEQRQKAAEEQQRLREKQEQEQRQKVEEEQQRLREQQAQALYQQQVKQHLAQLQEQRKKALEEQEALQQLQIQQQNRQLELQEQYVLQQINAENERRQRELYQTRQREKLQRELAQQKALEDLQQIQQQKQLLAQQEQQRAYEEVQRMRERQIVAEQQAFEQALVLQQQKEALARQQEMVQEMMQYPQTREVEMEQYMPPQTQERVQEQYMPPIVRQQEMVQEEPEVRLEDVIPSYEEVEEQMQFERMKEDVQEQTQENIFEQLLQDEMTRIKELEQAKEKEATRIKEMEKAMEIARERQRQAEKLKALEQAKEREQARIRELERTLALEKAKEAREKEATRIKEMEKAKAREREQTATKTVEAKPKIATKHQFKQIPAEKQAKTPGIYFMNPELRKDPRLLSLFEEFLKEYGYGTIGFERFVGEYEIPLSDENNWLYASNYLELQEKIRERTGYIFPQKELERNSLLVQQHDFQDERSPFSTRPVDPLPYTERRFSIQRPYEPVVSGTHRDRELSNREIRQKKLQTKIPAYQQGQIQQPPLFVHERRPGHRGGKYMKVNTAWLQTLQASKFIEEYLDQNSDAHGNLDPKADSFAQWLVEAPGLPDDAFVEIKRPSKQEFENMVYIYPPHLQ